LTWRARTVGRATSCATGSARSACSRPGRCACYASRSAAIASSAGAMPPTRMGARSGSGSPRRSTTRRARRATTGRCERAPAVVDPVRLRQQRDARPRRVANSRGGTLSTLSLVGDATGVAAVRWRRRHRRLVSSAEPAGRPSPCGPACSPVSRDRLSAPPFPAVLARWIDGTRASRVALRDARGARARNGPSALRATPRQRSGELIDERSVGSCPTMPRRPARCTQDVVSWCDGSWRPSASGTKTRGCASWLLQKALHPQSMRSTGSGALIDGPRSSARGDHVARTSPVRFDVWEHDVARKLANRLDRRRTVRGLADDAEPSASSIARADAPKSPIASFGASPGVSSRDGTRFCDGARRGGPRRAPSRPAPGGGWARRAERDRRAVPTDARIAL